jgi:hypothetical protein
MILIFFLSSPSFNYSTPIIKDGDSSLQIDTTKAIKIHNFWLIPKSKYDFTLLHDGFSDTLSLITCAEYVFSPFGTLNDKSDIPHSKLKNFKLSNRIKKMDVGDFEFQFLTLKSSRLILFLYNDPEATKHSYIFKGEIKDNEVNFVEGIKIGMTKDAFFLTFFESFPVDLLKQYRFVELKSCIEDITHTYFFKDNILQSVNFITNSYWSLDY